MAIVSGAKRLVGVNSSLFQDRKYHGGRTGLKGWLGEEKFINPVLDV